MGKTTSCITVFGHNECCRVTLGLGWCTGRPDVTNVGIWVTKVLAPVTGPPFYKVRYMVIVLIYEFMLVIIPFMFIYFYIVMNYPV